MGGAGSILPLATGGMPCFGNAVDETKGEYIMVGRGSVVGFFQVQVDEETWLAFCFRGWLLGDCDNAAVPLVYA